ncbi:MAG: hypothetical protein ACT4OO_08175 [Nitrospiraceae bacterium]
METSSNKAISPQRITSPSTVLHFDSPSELYELMYLANEEELLKQIKACCDLQRRASEKIIEQFVPYPKAKDEVSPAALELWLHSGRDRSDIRTNPDLSDCIVFHTTGFDHSVLREDIVVARQRVDAMIAESVTRLFANRSDLSVMVSGHFLYPPGGYMGWHTNSRVPGWRFYINYAEQVGKSFFRYRDPATASVVTAMDERWNFRLFRIDSQHPLWHAVYSDTYRYSLGYRIVRKT